jgi:hypothetical protein
LGGVQHRRVWPVNAAGWNRFRAIRPSAIAACQAYDAITTAFLIMSPRWMVS